MRAVLFDSSVRGNDLMPQSRLSSTCRWALCAAGLVLALPAAAFAQSGQTAQIPLQFDFLNPGARSLGLGSAFTAVADDATAAFTNPAGLTFILRPEISAEGRYRNLSTSFLSGGRLSGTPSGSGLDTQTGPQYGTSTDSAFRPYFVSVVYPIGRLSIAGFRHELVLQNNSFLSQGVFQQAVVGGGVFNNVRAPGLTGTRDIWIDNYGGAVALRVSSKLSVGADVSVYRFSDLSTFASLNSSQFGAVDPTSAGQSSTTVQMGTATSVGVNAGAIATLNSKVRVGAVFRQGVAFSFTQVNTVPNQPVTSENGQFKTPYVAGVGVRLQPSDELSVAIDYDRVGYSRLTQDFITFQVDPSEVGRVSIANGNEVHVGAEYTLVHMGHTPSLRAGVWFDPNHTVQYASDGTDSVNDQRLKATFPAATGIWHYCFGAGLPLSRSYEFNVGADLATGRQYVSVSVVARFGK
jgi:long-chain fatty acid transport protein